MKNELTVSSFTRNLTMSPPLRDQELKIHATILPYYYRVMYLLHYWKYSRIQRSILPFLPPSTLFKTQSNFPKQKKQKINPPQN